LAKSRFTRVDFPDPEGAQMMKTVVIMEPQMTRKPEPQMNTDEHR
jgi:hypothetical protein